MLTFDKHEMLCHDLLLIEAWCEEVFPRLAARVPEKAASKGYFVLYREATVLNLLAVFLYHACEAMGEVLLELIDYCMGKIVRLHCRPRDEVEKVLSVPAKELAAQLETVRGSHRLRRRPAMPCCARVAPVAPRGALHDLPGRAVVAPRAARSTRDGCWTTRWSCAGQLLVESAGASPWSLPMVGKVLSDDGGAIGVV